ncbi:MAG: phospho-N-acetylmuramoyl-pentapeptide-transferase, partial [Pyrinomonadaceae bacterium]
MIYYILYELIYGNFKDKEWYLVKALNVFQYVTFRTAYASITALLLSLVFGGKLIEALRKWNIGQQIREEGPQAHMAKRGTPTMGGVLIVGSVIISTLLWAKLSSVYVWTIMFATLGFAAIGFFDDHAKMAKQRSLGLTGRQKLLAQLVIAIGVWAVLYISTKYWASDYSWNVSIPFLKATAETSSAGVSYIGPFLYLGFIVIVLLGFSNGVNLTDGLDGLAISVTFI